MKRKNKRYRNLGLKTRLKEGVKYERGNVKERKNEFQKKTIWRERKIVLLDSKRNSERIAMTWVSQYFIFKYVT